MALGVTLVVVLLASAGFVRPAAAQRPAVETFERTLPLPSGGSFSLANINGSVEIEGWDREEVQIFARKLATAEAGDLRHVDIAVTSSAEGVSVTTRYPEGGAVEVNVEFRVRVPARVRLDRISTVNGSVAVRNVSGEGRLAAVNGNVVLARGAGSFSARSTNGSVSLEVLSFDGGLPLRKGAALRPGISVQTVNGTVALALPAGAGAELDAHTQNGDFSSELPLLSHSSAAGRAIRGRVGSGGLPVFLRTVNGSIRLRISRPLV
jgi:hypothetical protein